MKEDNFGYEYTQNLDKALIAAYGQNYMYDLTESPVQEITHEMSKVLAEAEDLDKDKWVYLAVRLVGVNYAPKDVIKDLESRYRDAEHIQISLQPKPIDKYPHALSCVCEHNHIGHIPDLLAQALFNEEFVGLMMLDLKYNYTPRGPIPVPVVLLRTTRKAWSKYNPTTITFGKYKGQNLRDVFASDPAYIGWVSEKKLVDLSLFTDEEIKFAKEANAQKEVERLSATNSLP